MPRVQMQCILAKRQSHFQYPRDIISLEKSHVLSQGSDPMSDGHQIYNPRDVRSPEENKSCIISCSTEQVANLTVILQWMPTCVIDWSTEQVAILNVSQWFHVTHPNWSIGRPDTTTTLHFGCPTHPCSLRTMRLPRCVPRWSICTLRKSTILQTGRLTTFQDIPRDHIAMRISKAQVLSLQSCNAY